MPNNNKNEDSTASKIEAYKSIAMVILWVVGLIFSAGIFYSKIVTMEESDKKQEKTITQTRDAQLRTAEAVERLEKAQIEFSRRMLEITTKALADQAVIEKRVLRNELKVEELEKDVKEVKAEIKGKV